MKTLTEFAGVHLKNAIKAKQELLAAGKTPEELPSAMGEALKLEGDKLGFLLTAIELVENKLDNLKRVVVFTLVEGEKAPSSAQQKGEQYFTTEFYPPIAGKGAPQGKSHPAGKHGGKDGDKKRRRGRRRNQGQPGHPSGEANAAAPGGGERGRRPPRRDRGAGGPRGAGHTGPKANASQEASNSGEKKPEGQAALPETR